MTEYPYITSCSITHVRTEFVSKAMVGEGRAPLNSEHPFMLSLDHRAQEIYVFT